MKLRDRTHVAPVLPLAIAVVCWIGITNEGDRRIVRLAGRLGEEQVPELLQACEGFSALTVDLTDLVFADPAGLEVLQRIRKRRRVDGRARIHPAETRFAEADETWRLMVVA